MIEKPYLVVSYYTNNVPYVSHSRMFFQSANAHGVPYHVTCFQPFGSWEKSCANKPRFILDALNGPNPRNRAIIWVDIDAVVQSYPDYFDAFTQSHHEIMGHFTKPGTFTHNSFSRVLSGVCGFKDTEYTRRILNQWIRLCDSEPHVWDQTHFMRAIQLCSTPGEISRLWMQLPESYFRIKGRRSNPGSSPNVILHNQASRDYRVKKEHKAAKQPGYAGDVVDCAYPDFVKQILEAQENVA